MTVFHDKDAPDGDKRRGKGPVLIEIDQAGDAPRPDMAAPVPDLVDMVGTSAMARAALRAGRAPSRLARWFWGAAVSLTGFVISLAAWDYLNGLLARSPVLGGIAAALIALVLAVLALIALREMMALGRLKRVDGLRAAAERAASDGDLTAARAVTAKIQTLYARREDAAWGLTRFKEETGDPVDADALLALAERRILHPLDDRATREVEAAARQVATVTAIVPLALADVATALVSNLLMIRRIAEIYGGRGGTLASWRLTRAVMAHLVATGAVAIGDDMIGSIAGGGVLSKLSRRFGEGVINGALTARVGVAAMEVCRPLPFVATHCPSVTQIGRRALSGLFGAKDA